MQNNSRSTRPLPTTGTPTFSVTPPATSAGTAGSYAPVLRDTSSADVSVAAPTQMRPLPAGPPPASARNSASLPEVPSESLGFGVESRPLPSGRPPSQSRLTVVSTGSVDGAGAMPLSEELPLSDQPLDAKPRGALFSRGALAVPSRCQLRVFGYQCRGLRATDSNGLSDPYLVFRVGKHRCPTRVIPKTLNPVWENPIEDEVTFGAPNGILKPEEFEREDNLYVTVMDKDTFTDDVVGDATIFFGDMFPSIAPETDPVTGQPKIQVTRKAVWHTLYHDGRRAGEVFLCLEASGYRPLPEGAILTYASNALALPGAGPDLLLGIVQPPNCLKVTVHGARNLRDRTGGCNAYVRLDVASLTARSQVVSSRSPVWQEGWAFPVVERASVLEIEVNHSGFISTTFQGRTGIYLSNFDAQRGKKVRAWYELMGKQGVKDKDRGEIDLEVCWEYNKVFAQYMTQASHSTSKLTLAAIKLGPDGEPEIPEDLAKSLSGELPHVPPSSAAAGKPGSWGEVEESTPATDTSKVAAAEPPKNQAEVELKEGDWKIQVHIIEARQLKAENYNGTSDPVVYVTVAGKTQHTAIHKNVTSCVFDHHMFFDFPKQTRDDVEAMVVTVAVYDANLIARNELIGKFVFDPLDVYRQPHHCYNKRWVGIVDTENGKDKGLQGYVRLSISVLGPGDQVYIPDENTYDSFDTASAADATEKEKPKEATSALSLFKGRKRATALLAMRADKELADVDEEVAASSLLLLPPLIRRETRWLVIGCHGAAELPAMDETGALGLYTEGIDAYLKVQFAGNPACKTQWVTAVGASNLAVEWNRELWIPFNYPTFTNRIEVAVMDFDRFKENDRVGTIVLDYRDISAKKLPPAWWPVYGAPNHVYFGKYKNKMNRLPNFATTYRGRVLLSARIEKTAENKGVDKVHWKPTMKIPRELLPPLAVFRLRALIVAGDELPTISDGKLGSVELGVQIVLGDKQLSTKCVKVIAGQAKWSSLSEFDVALPISAGGLTDYGKPSPAPLPDTFIYLYYGDITKKAKRIAYARLDTEALVRSKLAGSVPYWQPLREDMAVNAIGNDDSAGSILMRLGIGSQSEAGQADWRSDLRELEHRQPYELRVHVFQGRNLPAADSNGLLDPYLRVNLGGNPRQTSIRYETAAPAWYETISMELMLPALRFAPQLHVELWDKDEFFGDDFVSELRLDLGSPDILLCSGRHLPNVLPDPKWYPLSRLETKYTNDALNANKYGEVLMLVQLIAKDAPNQVVPMIPATIKPECRQMYLEIVALGCRNLAPYGYLPIAYPHVDFYVGGIDQNLSRSSRKGSQLHTLKSRRPTGTNPNFCERMVVPINIPLNPLFAPSVTMMVWDNRLGGINTVCVGTTSVALCNKIPWSDTFTACKGRYTAPSENPALLADASSDAPVASTPKMKVAHVAVASADVASLAPEQLTPPRPSIVETNSKRSSSAAPPLNVDAIALDVSPQAAAKDDNVVAGSGLLTRLFKGKQFETNELPTPQPAATLAEEEFKHEFGIDLTTHTHTRDAAEFLDDLDQRKYLHNRREFDTGLETVFQVAPFEAFRLSRGQLFGRGFLGGNERSVGVFKGMLRLCEKPDDPSPIDMQNLLNPRTYVVRVYVLTGAKIQPKDSNGKSDCYLVAKLGKTVINKRSEYIPANTDPEFYQAFEFRTTLPGPSSLTLEVWDYDRFTSDDFIGSTQIDLEDRWFEPAWHKLGEECETSTRLRPKPIERRDIWAPKSQSSQGQLRLWVDILTPEDARTYPLIAIAPPKPREYELRLIVWKARNMTSADAVTGMNDLYIKAWVEGMKAQSTDVHYRAKHGKASWNWRMKWTVTIPRKHFQLKFQAWDKDVVKYNDFIGQAELDLGPVVRRCLRQPDRGMHVFQSDAEILAERKKRLEAQRQKNAARLGNIVAEEDAKAAAAQQQLQNSMIRSGIATPEYAAQQLSQQQLGKSATFGGGSITRGTAAAVGDTGASKTGEQAEVQSLYQRATAGVSAAASGVGSRVGKLFATTGDDDTLHLNASASTTTPAAGAGKTGLSDRATAGLTGLPIGTLVGLRNATEAGDAKATIAALKKAAGIETDVHPEHGQWLQLKKTTHEETGIYEDVVGEVLVSIEMLPAAVADKYPAGYGRSQPNQHPTLPPPMGRIRCSINPFYLLNECCGPRICTIFACGLCCVLIGAAVFFGAPFINTLMTWLQLMPAAVAAPVGIIIGLIVCVPPLYCYCRFVCCPTRVDPDEAVLDGSASDMPKEIMPDGLMDQTDDPVVVNIDHDAEDGSDTAPLIKRAVSGEVKRPSISVVKPTTARSVSSKLPRHSVLKKD